MPWRGLFLSDKITNKNHSSLMNFNVFDRLTLWFLLNVKGRLCSFARAWNLGFLRRQKDAFSHLKFRYVSYRSIIAYNLQILLYLSEEVLISLKVFSENLSNYIKIFLSQV